MTGGGVIDDRHGECLCGAVTVTMPAAATTVEACHCAMCLRWCGGPFLSVHAPDGSVVAGETLAVHRSSAFAERGFCSRCGSSIFYRLQDGPELMVSAGLFDTAGMTLRREIFIDRKPGFYGFTGETEKWTAFRSTVHWAPRIVWRSLRRALGRGRAAGG